MKAILVKPEGTLPYGDTSLCSEAVIEIVEGKTVEEVP